MAENKEKNPQTTQEYLELVKSTVPEVKWEKGQPQTVTPENMNRFVRGELTWAQVTGVSMEQAYAMAELGYNLFNQGKFEDARKIFEGLIVLNPFDGYFHAMLGAVFARQNKPEEALRAFNIAAGLEPKDSQVFVNRAEIYLRTGKFEEALSDLRQAIEIDPEGNNPAVIRARAMAAATVQLIQEIVKNKLASTPAEASAKSAPAKQKK